MHRHVLRTRETKVVAKVFSTTNTSARVRSLAAVAFIQRTDISVDSPGKVSSTGFALGGHILP